MSGTTTTDPPLHAVEDDEELAREADAAGKSIEELAAERAERGDEPAEEKPLPPMQLPLEGTTGTISQSFGGARATSSEMRLQGGKQPIEGQFNKGDTVMLLVEAKVFQVAGVDFTDDWGNVQRTSRRHTARIISCRRYEE